MSSSGIDYRFIQPNTVPQFINKQVIPATTNQNASCNVWVKSVQMTNPAAGLAGIASWVALCP